LQALEGQNNAGERDKQPTSPRRRKGPIIASPSNMAVAGFLGRIIWPWDQISAKIFAPHE
jgi:hypothetical protein